MKTKRQKLLDELDSLCSQYVRQRDNECVLCGAFKGEPKKLQSHHWIVSRKRSNRYKFDERNCVALCYSCHIHKIHSTASYFLIEKLKERALLKRIATKEDIEEIVSHSHDIYKPSIIDIEDKINYFKGKLNGTLSEKDV
ncbi:MAG: HNH endonuclease signature motif containing protein [Acutalibacteraceae bacterium]|nr:HNH endonuclease signature motif containing protein [Acutalibacteraceae bacterium]